MKQPKISRSKKTKSLIILMAVALVLLGIGVLFGPALWDLFSDQQRLESTIKDAGPWGPVVLILLQILQVVAAPIPGQVVSFVAGYLFGTLFGTLYTMIGVTVGFTLVILLSRKLGRPFVERFVNKKTLEKFDYLAESRGVFIFFLMALLPFFPDDLICFIAGLTKIRVRNLVLVTFVGRLPTNLIYAFAGQGVAESNMTLVFLVLGIGLVASVVLWWKRESLERLAKSLSKTEDSR